MADLGFLTRAPFAHRGLHSETIIENSRASWEAAVAAGHGIECDVVVSDDGVAMVFHDYRLKRLTGAKGSIGGKKAAELGETKLAGCDETVPTLAEMLALLDRRAPLLIEIKVRGTRVNKICRSVAQALADYAGEAAVMSFNPEVGRWFALNAPDVVRGLVVSERGEGSVIERLKGPMSRSLSVFRARPHFLAYDIRDLPSAFAAPLRAEGMPVLTWTVRTPAQVATARDHADQIIYEPA
ncbi:MAG: glycerophosphodiester phosphodiesterase [Sphingomonadaceae bacterium]|nr:glycerophosphodiester phosphodiesterase [Sphingomonadaceae bacterium]